VYVAVTRLVQKLGAAGIRDDKKFVEAKAVEHLKADIAHVAERCNPLLKTRIKATGDAKCMSYILQALVGSTFSRDSTEKGFCIVPSPLVAELAASLVEPKEDMVELYDTLDE